MWPSIRAPSGSVLKSVYADSLADTHSLLLGLSTSRSCLLSLPPPSRLSPPRRPAGIPGHPREHRSLTPPPLPSSCFTTLVRPQTCVNPTCPLRSACPGPPLALNMAGKHEDAGGAHRSSWAAASGTSLLPRLPLSHSPEVSCDHLLSPAPSTVPCPHSLLTPLFYIPTKLKALGSSSHNPVPMTTQQQCPSPTVSHQRSEVSLPITRTSLGSGRFL